MDYLIFPIAMLFGVGIFCWWHLKCINKAAEQRRSLSSYVYLHNMEQIRQGIIFPDTSLWDELREKNYNHHLNELLWGRNPWLIYSPEIQEVWYKYNDGSRPTERSSA